MKQQAPPLRAVVIQGLTLTESLAYRVARRLFYKLFYLGRGRRLDHAERLVFRVALTVYAQLLNKRDGKPPRDKPARRQLEPAVLEQIASELRGRPIGAWFLGQTPTGSRDQVRA